MGSKEPSRTGFYPAQRRTSTQARQSVMPRSVLHSVADAAVYLTHTCVAQESSPGAGPGGQAAAGMFWQYGRDVAEQLQATRAAVDAAIEAMRRPQASSAVALGDTDSGAPVSVKDPAWWPPCAIVHTAA